LVLDVEIVGVVIGIDLKDAAINSPVVNPEVEVLKAADYPDGENLEIKEVQRRDEDVVTPIHRLLLSTQPKKNILQLNSSEFPKMLRTERYINYVYKRFCEILKKIRELVFMLCVSGYIDPRLFTRGYHGRWGWDSETI